MKKRILSILLVITMLFAALPLGMLPTLAAGETETFPLSIKPMISGTVALKSDGTVWAWGSGYMPFYDDSTYSSSCARQIDGLTDIAAVSMGRTSLALKSDGTVWQWGYIDIHGWEYYIPVKVEGLSDVIAISAGGTYSLILKSDGTVWAWGENRDGQLGNGTTEESETPVQVSNLSGITTISAGGTHSLAVRNDGTVWTWGNNTFQQLGNSTNFFEIIPVQVEGLTDITAVSAGSRHSLALKKDGTVWTWGDNADGQLGNSLAEICETPVRVENLSGVTAVSAAGNSSLALKSNGTVWGWGNNLWGQLIDLKYTVDECYYYHTPVQLKVLIEGFSVKDIADDWKYKNITSAVAISTTGDNSYVIKSDGTIWDWGTNDHRYYHFDYEKYAYVHGQLPVPVSLGKIYNEHYTKDQYFYLGKIGRPGDTSSGYSNTTSFNILENSGEDNYISLSGVTIKVNGANYQAMTGSSGLADIFVNKVKNPAIYNCTVTISKPGYLPLTTDKINWGGSNVIGLEKASGVYPAVKGVFYRDDDNLWQDMRVTSTVITKDTKKYHNLYLDIDWGSGGYSDVKLTQNLFGVKSIAIGSSLNAAVNFAQSFYTGKNFCIEAKGSDGKTARKKLQLNLLDAKVIDPVELPNANIAPMPADTPILNGFDLGLTLGKINVNLKMKDDGTFIGALGAAASINSLTEKQVEEFCRDLKMCVNPGFKINGDKWDTFTKTKKDLISMSGKKMSADFMAGGYVEGVVTSSGAKITGGGLIVSVGGKLKFTKASVLPFAPYIGYFECGISAGSESKLGLEKKISETIMKVIGQVSFSVGIEVGAGLGFPNTLSVGAYVDAGGKVTAYSPDNRSTAEIEIGGGIKATCWVFENKWDLGRTKWTYDTSVGGSWQRQILQQGNWEEVQASPQRAFYNTSEYTLSSRVEGASEFLANSARSKAAFNAFNISNISTVIKSNVSESTKSSVINLDGDKKLAVWVDQDNSRTDINRTNLMYSYYNGTNWSNPQSVSNDGTADFEPQLVKSNGNVCLVWQNAAKQFASNMQLEEFAKNIDVYAAQWNGTAFTSIKNISNNNNADLMPKVTASGNGIYVAWVNNSLNDVFGTTGSNTISYAEYSNGTVSAVRQLVSGLKCVTDFDLISENENACVAYTTDSDNNLSTVNDRKIYYYDTAQTQIETEPNAETGNVKFASLYYQNVMFWNQNGEICYAPLNDLSDIKKINTAEFDCFDVISEYYGNTVITFAKPENGTINYYGVYYGVNLGWGEPVKLTNENCVTSNASFSFNQSGDLDILFNRSQIEDINTYTLGQTDLCFHTVKSQSDVSISEINFDYAQLFPGNIAEFKIPVKNSGTKPLESILIELLDGDNNVIESETRYVNLLAGQSAELLFEYQISEDFTERELTFRITPDGQAAIIKKAPLLFDDIEVSGVSIIGEGDNRQVIARIKNNSPRAVGNIKISALDESAAGDILNEKSISNLGPYESKLVIFSMDEIFTEKGQIIYIKAETANDINPGNNDNFTAFITAEDVVGKKGDVNGDNDINIFDIMAIRDHIFGKSILEGNTRSAADVNDDETVNIFDIMRIRDHIFGKALLDE